MINRQTRLRAWGPALPLLMILLIAPTGHAQDIDLPAVYDRVTKTSPAVRGAHYHALAAQQAIATARRGYRPTAVVHVNELWVEQNVDQVEIEALRSGRETFRNRRAMVEVEQPLFDATHAPRVRAAEARLRHRRYVAEHTTAHTGQRVIENYLLAARLNTLLQ